MARMLRDARLGSREQRSRLKVRGKPYWRMLEPGLHLGYRRLAGRAGTWCVRRYVGNQKYEVSALGGAMADDYADADGRSILSFAAAQRRALEHKPKADGPYSVRQAAAAYVEFLRHHRKTARDAELCFDAFVLPKLGDVAVADLTAEQLRKWLNALAATPRRVRSAKGAPPRHATASDDPETRRKRQVTANRVWTVFRAALNQAFHDGKVSSDSAWKRVKMFRGVNQPKLRFLSADECRRLVNVAQGDFRRLVLAALHSGCRLGELAALVVSDFHQDSGTLLVRTSKAGKSRTVWLSDEAQQLFRTWCAGRRGDQLILERDTGGPWKRAMQNGRMLDVCTHAGIVPPVPFHNLRHTHASHLAMRGVPLQVIAEQLGHADHRMTQRYRHLSETYVGATVRQSALRLDVEPDSTVVPLPVRP
jgi:integrase